MLGSAWDPVRPHFDINETEPVQSVHWPLISFPLSGCIRQHRLVIVDRKQAIKDDIRAGVYWLGRFIQQQFPVYRSLTRAYIVWAQNLRSHDKHDPDRQRYR